MFISCSYVVDFMSHYIDNKDVFLLAVPRYV